MAIDSIKAMGTSYQGSVTPTNKVSVATEPVAASSTGDGTSSAETQAAVVQIASTRTEAGREGETPERKSVQQDSLRKAVDTINKKVNTEAVFGIHDETNRVTIKIVDRESKKVIKELPPEKTLDMIAKVWELAGIFVDEKR